MILRKDIGDSVITLDDAKMYLGFVGRDDRDAEIQTALNAALLIVEERQDVSLRPMTVELPTTGSGWKRLYLLPVVEVLSVKDARSGKDLEYSLAYDKRSILVKASQSYVVEYSTEPINDHMMDVYRTGVLAVASLIFDGSTDAAAYRQVFNAMMIPSNL